MKDVQVQGLRDVETSRKRKQREYDCECAKQIAEFRKEMMAFLESFREKQNEDLQKMWQNWASDIKNEINHITSVTEGLVEEQKNQKSDLSNLKDRVSSTENALSSLSKLPKDMDEAKETIKVLQMENNNSKQYSMLNNVEISGVSYAAGENLTKIVHDISSFVGVVLTDNDIDVIHRVRRYPSKEKNESSTRPPAIILRFTQRRKKDELLAAVRARRGLTTANIGLPGPAVSLYVSDHLTPTNKLLLKRARELKVSLGYSYIWVRDCKIFMRKNDKSRSILISDHIDLQKLK